MKCTPIPGEKSEFECPRGTLGSFHHRRILIEANLVWGELITARRVRFRRALSPGKKPSGQRQSPALPYFCSGYAGSARCDPLSETPRWLTQALQPCRMSILALRHRHLSSRRARPSPKRLGTLRFSAPASSPCRPRGRRQKTHERHMNTRQEPPVRTWCRRCPPPIVDWWSLTVGRLCSRDAPKDHALWQTSSRTLARIGCGTWIVT